VFACKQECAAASLRTPGEVRIWLRKTATYGRAATAVGGELTLSPSRQLRDLPLADLAALEPAADKIVTSAGRCPGT